MFADLRFAIRQIARTPGFSLVVVLTLGLGIGANAAIFSLLSSVMLEPLPYPDADRVVRIYETTPDGDTNSVAGGAFKDWHEHSSSFAHLAVYETTRRNLTGAGQPQRITGLQASAEFLPVLGVEPFIGRGFAAGEDQVGGENRVVMLTHAFWLSHYGGEEGAVGEVVRLDEIPHTVIGVLPPHALLDDDVRIVVPNVIDEEGVHWGRAGHWRAVVGRLRAQRSLSDAQAEIAAIKERLNAEYPPFKEDWGVKIVPLKEVVAGEARPTLLVLLGTVSLVLLIACTNVSNLLLARGCARSREMAIRSALGAGSSRIVRQVLVESLLLALMGCGVGLMHAAYGIEILGQMVSGDLPSGLRPELDLRVFAFSLAIACGCALLFGLLPALRARKPSLEQDLKEGSKGSASASRKRSQSLLVVSEFALTLVLLVGAGLFLRSFLLQLQVDPGFDPESALVFDLSFADAKYPEREDRLRFTQALTQQIAAVPGVEYVGATTAPPLGNGSLTDMASRMDQPPHADYVVSCEFISGDYFSAMGMKLLRGRTITAADNAADAPKVMVIDRGVAEDLYPGEDPIGKQLRLFGEGWEIVGIVAPMRRWALSVEPPPSTYMAQIHSSAATSIAVRASVPPLSLAESMREAVLAVDPAQPIDNVRTLEQAVSRSLATERTTLILVGLFALLAVGLACIGIYGVMSYAVGLRGREFCIRSALGAERGDVLRLVLKGGLLVSSLGIAVGLVGALALARLLESQLFEIRAHDPLVYASSIALLLLVAGASILLPARRASRANPIDALRSE